MTENEQSEENKLAKLVKEIMNAKGLSSYQVQMDSIDANGDKISQTSVSKILRGVTKNPSIPIQRALARGLGVPEKIIFNAASAGDIAEDSEITLTISSYVNELPPNVQEDVLLIVETFYKKYVK